MEFLPRAAIAALIVPLWLSSHAVIAAEKGAPAPPLSLPTASGELIDLNKLRGKVVYVDFWASWCTPCRRAFPWMAEMQKKYGSSGLAIVAVNVDKKREDAQKFLQGFPAPPFTIVYDPQGATPTAWKVKAMPSSYLIDRKGNIASVEAGFHDAKADDVESRMKALIGAP